MRPPWIGDVNAEVFAGSSNWRVPTLDELLTIVNLNAGPPRIDPIFGPTQRNRYWSSTDFNVNGASYVDFIDGHVFAFFKGNFVPVRAVRTGS
jgi:hypothetical protein